MDCAFCQNLQSQNRIIVENETAFAFPTIIPIVPGHVLICPKRHVQYYEKLEASEKDGMEELRIRIKAALRKLFGAQGFNYAWNEEIIGGQSVPHMHLHIIPRKEGDSGVYEYEPRKFLYRPGTRAASPEHELDDIARTIKENL